MHAIKMGYLTNIIADSLTGKLIEIVVQWVKSVYA